MLVHCIHTKKHVYFLRILIQISNCFEMNKAGCLHMQHTIYRSLVLCTTFYGSCYVLFTIYLSFVSFVGSFYCIVT